MKLKVGDHIKIITGKDSGKEGTIIKTLRQKDCIIVDGLNMVKKHIKEDSHGNPGGIIEREAPLHISNVKLITKQKNKTKPSQERQTPKPQK